MPKKTKNANELEKTSVDLKHEFDEKELRQLAKKLSQSLLDRMKMENELKNVKNEYKTKLENLDSEIGIMNEKFSSEYEMRDTPCYLFRNFATGKRQYLSALDKTDILKEEPLTAEDHQLKMNMDTEQED